MKSAIHFLTFITFISLPWMAQGEEISDLCGQGTEGSFVGKLDDSTQARLNLFCIEDSRMMGSLVISRISSTSESDPIILHGFGNVAVADGQLILSSYPIRNEDRRGISSKTSATYVKMDLPSLRLGKIHGTYVDQSSTRFQELDLLRVQTFPKLEAGVAGSVPKQALAGKYVILNTPYGHQATLLADVLGDTPVFTLVFPGLTAIHLLDGPVWDGTGRISAATPQGDGEPDAHMLFYVRGRWLSPKELEIYWVDINQGLEGPYRATRVESD